MSEIAGLSLVSDVRIQEGEGKNFGTKSYEICIPAGDPDSVSIHEFSEPIPISILAAHIIGEPKYDGDTIEFQIAPNTTIGALAADAAAGTNTLVVSPTVLEYLEVGFWVDLFDGTQLIDCGQALAIDLETGIVTIEKPLVEALTAATPIYLQMTAKMVPHGKLPTSSRLLLGGNKIGGTLLDANISLKIIYKNHDGLAKTFDFWLEYMY